MSCNNFKCVNLVDGECDQDGGECIGDLCENWGECQSCQKVEDPGDCWSGRPGRESRALY